MMSLSFEGTYCLSSWYIWMSLLVEHFAVTCTRDRETYCNVHALLISVVLMLSWVMVPNGSNNPSFAVGGKHLALPLICWCKQYDYRKNRVRIWTAIPLDYNTIADKICMYTSQYIFDAYALYHGSKVDSNNTVCAWVASCTSCSSCVVAMCPEQCFLFQNEINYFLDTLIQKIFF